MTTERDRPAESDPDHPDFMDISFDVDHDKWDRVQEGSRVIGSDGEDLGRVRDKSKYVFVVDARRGMLTTDELYVPHIAIDHLDGDHVHLKWNRAQLKEAYEHARRFHFQHPAQG